MKLLENGSNFSFNIGNEQGIDVTNELEWAAVRDAESGNSVLALLFEQIQQRIKVLQSIINFVPSSEDENQVIPANSLIIVRYASTVKVRSRLQLCQAQQLSVPISVVNATLINENRNEVVREFLCGSNIYVKEDAARCSSIVKLFEPLCIQEPTNYKLHYSEGHGYCKQGGS